MHSKMIHSTAAIYISPMLLVLILVKSESTLFLKEICARRLSSKKSFQYLPQSLALSDPVDRVVSPVGHVVQAVELAAVE